MTSVTGRVGQSSAAAGRDTPPSIAAAVSSTRALARNALCRTGGTRIESLPLFCFQWGILVQVASPGNARPEKFAVILPQGLKRQRSGRALGGNSGERFDHVVDDRLDQNLIVAFTHHPDHRLGAGRAHDQASA